VEDGLRPPEEPRTAASVAASEANNSSNSKLWLMLGIVVVALLLVLLVLPSVVTDKTAARPAPAVETQQKVADEDPLQSVAADQLRADAEKALQKFLHTQAHPDLRNADIWAFDDWQLALNTAAQGDKEFGRGSFATALQAYRDAGAQLQSILDNREQTLQQNLDAGWQYLQVNAVAEASDAFDRVIAMQSDHQQAHLGLERAAVRKQVLEFVSRAQQAEATNSLQLAAQAYRPIQAHCNWTRFIRWLARPWIVLKPNSATAPFRIPWGGHCRQLMMKNFPWQTRHWQKLSGFPRVMRL